MRIESKNASHAMLWTSGNLFFDEVLLSDIAKELERRYNVRITILGESLQQLRVYASFVAQDVGIREIMDILSSTNHLQYSVKGKEIIIQ